MIGGLASIGEPMILPNALQKLPRLEGVVVGAPQLLDVSRPWVLSLAVEDPPDRLDVISVRSWEDVERQLLLGVGVPCLDWMDHDARPWTSLHPLVERTFYIAEWVSDEDYDVFWVAHRLPFHPITRPSATTFTAALPCSYWSSGKSTSPIILTLSRR